MATGLRLPSAFVPTSSSQRMPPPAAAALRGDRPALAPAARHRPRAEREDPDGGAGGRAAAA